MKSHDQLKKMMNKLSATELERVKMIRMEFRQAKTAFIEKREARNRTIRSLHEEGFTFRELSRILNTDMDTVERAVKDV